jgi:hypothetical protein
VRNPSPRKTLQQELSVQAGQRASATWRIFAVARALLVVANFREHLPSSTFIELGQVEEDPGDEPGSGGVVR